MAGIISRCVIRFCEFRLLIDRTMKTIIVIGDLNLDIIFSHIDGQPAFGKEIGAKGCVMKPGGSAANTALLLAVNGCPVRFYGLVGRDFAGYFVVKSLEEYGVKTDTVSFSDAEATGATVSLTYPNDRMYITFPGTVSLTGPDHLPEPGFSKDCHLHLASWFLQTGMRPYFCELLKRAKEEGMTTSLDPGGDVSGEWDMDDLKDRYQYIDFFLPNREELLNITKKSDLKKALDSFSEKIPFIIVKVGADGAFVRDWGGVSHYPALPADVLDTTCAGDSFNAGFLCGISRGMDIADSVRLGNRYGAAAVSTVGLPLRRTA